jgi:two-component system sensor histidine kinase/response regulator
MSRIFCIWLLVCMLFPSSMVAQQTDSLEQVLSQSKGFDRVQPLFQLGIAYRYNNPNLAIKYFEEMMQLQGVDAHLKAQALQQVGNIYFIKGDFQKSKDAYNKAVLVFSDLQFYKYEADVLLALGGIYFAQGNMGLAADFYLRALRYYESVSEDVGMVNCYAALGDLYARQNNFSRAIEFTQKAISKYEQSSNKMQALVGYEAMGNAYLKLNNMSKAAEFYNKALNEYKAMKNEAGIALTYLQLGIVSQKQGNTRQAILYFDKAKSIAGQLKLQQILLQSMLGIAACQTTENKLSEAEIIYSQVVKMAQRNNMKPELEEAYSGLERIYQLMSETTKARTFGSLSRELKDSLYNDSMLKSLSDLQLRFEAEKQQREIDLLSKDQIIRESELLRIRQLNRFIGVGAAIVVMMFSVLLYFFVQNKKYASSLQKHTNELTQLNKVKDRFFSIISHDLRNNLSTMKLYFDLISNPNYNPEDSKGVTKQIAASVENTIDLLENLLVWASSEIKGIPIHPVQLNMDDVVQSNIKLLQANAHQKQLTLLYTPTLQTYARADEDMINLVVRNLIANAIKFTEEGGCIHVKTSIHPDGYIHTCVQDNGVGMSDENKSKLFNQHLHPTTKGTGNEKGTGLGLLLCKEFVERNGGKIWVESEKGKGSCFFFSLPAAV